VLVTSFLLWPAPVPAGGGESSGPDFRARLTPCCDAPDSHARGAARRKVVVKEDVVRADSFMAKVKLPVPPDGLAAHEPEPVEVCLVLSRLGEPYARCVLAPEEDDGEEAVGATGQGGYEDDEVDTYHVKLGTVTKRGTPVLRVKWGHCDVDLVTEGVQPGVPDVHPGDVATVSVFDPASSSSMEILQGTFVEH